MHAPQKIAYRIVVEGTIDPLWIACLGGLEIHVKHMHEELVITRLEGSLADQSALHGVLNTLFMLGLRLVYIKRLPSDVPLGRDRH